MPTRPRINGTSVCADVHANCTPPHVSPSTVAVELAMMMKLPLISTSVKTPANAEAEFLHPVHAAEFLAERTRRRLQLEEDGDQRRGDARDGQVEVCAPISMHTVTC